MPILARAWQMLLKGLQEAQFAPDPMQAAEMVLVRLAYAADLPPPADLVKRLTQGGEGSTPRTAAPVAGSNGGPRAHAAGPQTMSAPVGGGAPSSPTISSPTMTADGVHALAARSEPVMAAAQPVAEPMPASFREAVALFARKREGLLQAHLMHDVHPVSFAPGRIEFRPRPEAPRELPRRVSELLSQWTGQRWFVSLSDQPGQPTLAEQEASRKQADRDEAAQHPFVRAALQAFPGARITEVRTTRPVADFVPSDGEPPDGDAPPEPDDMNGEDDGPYDDGAPPPRFEGDYRE
jgi:DNA polymerase-3 subunit gamma/tau